MSLIETGTINTTQPFLKGFNGQKVKLYRNKDSKEPVVGKSGNSHLYDLHSPGSIGKGLFLEQDDIAPIMEPQSA